MKKSSILSFIASFLFPYILILLGVFCYRGGFYLMVLLIILSVIMNRFAVKKALPFIVLTANLSVVSALSFHFYYTLYARNVSADSATLLIGKTSVFTSVLYVITLSVAAWFFIKILNNAFESKFKNASQNLESRSNNKSGNAFSVLSLIILILAIVSVAAEALVIGFSSYIWYHSYDSPLLTFLSITIPISILLLMSSVVFSYLATSKSCSNYKIAIAARCAGYFFIISLLASPVIILTYAAPVSSVMELFVTTY